MNASSPTSFDATGVNLTYDYVLTNTGNVTLNTPTITDNLVAATCTDTSIPSGEQITCTSANYPTTQGNINQGGVTNTATAYALVAVASGTTAPTITSNSDEVTVPSVQTPAISLVKTAPTVTAAQFVVGGTVTYTFDVTNTGNVRIAGNIGVSEVNITDSKIGTFKCFDTPLNRNQTMSCTAYYELTVADINAGIVQNTATATAGTTSSPQAVATISPDLMPAVSITKTADVANVAATSDTITYTFAVTNSGDTQIFLATQPITINDAKLATAADCSAQPATMEPNDSFDCTGTYNPTQAELDTGMVDNAATASFPFTQDGSTATITSVQVTESVPVIQTPLFTFTKVAAPAAFTSVGETITYTLAVNNTGNVTFTNITVTDPLIPTLSCTFTDVAPGDTPSCTGDYDVTQDDMDAEVVNNVATAAGQTAGGAGLTLTAAEVVLADTNVATMIASVAKSADKTDFTTVGEVITYTLAVTNDGTQTLTNLAVTDSLDATYSCNVARLLPTITSSICTFTHEVTQADINAGKVDNTATVASPQITTANSPQVTVNGPTRTSSYTLTKTAASGFNAAGDIVDFTFAVENTGNTTLTNVNVIDNDVTPALNCTIPSILPGVTDSTSCTVSYTVLQNDVDVGQFTNTATSTAAAPAGVTTPTPQNSTAIVAGPAENAAVEITKSSTDGVYTSATDSEVYTFSVENTGNVTLTNLSVSDPALGGVVCALDDLLPGATTTTCTGGAPLTLTKSFSQIDVDAASFTNEASVTGQSLVNATVVSDDDTVVVTGPVQAPALTMVKGCHQCTLSPDPQMGRFAGRSLPDSRAGRV